MCKSISKMCVANVDEISLFLLFIRFYFFHFTTAVQSRWFGEHWWTHGENKRGPPSILVQSNGQSHVSSWLSVDSHLDSTHLIGRFASTSKGSSNHPGGVPWCPPSMSGSPFWRQTRGVSGVLIMAWMEGVGAPLPGVSFAKFASREQQMKRVVGCSEVLLCLLLMLEVLAGGCHGPEPPFCGLDPN